MLTPVTVRLDLKCGKGSISAGEKCTKGPATRAKKKNKGEVDWTKVATGLAVGAGALGVASSGVRLYRDIRGSKPKVFQINVRPPAPGTVGRVTGLTYKKGISSSSNPPSTGLKETFNNLNESMRASAERIRQQTAKMTERNSFSDQKAVNEYEKARTRREIKTAMGQYRQAKIRAKKGSKQVRGRVGVSTAPRVTGLEVGLETEKYGRWETAINGQPVSMLRARRRRSSRQNTRLNSMWADGFSPSYH